MPDSKHPIWKLARLLIVGGFLLGFLALNYNRFDNRDLMTIFGTLAGLLGFDTIKSRITHAKEATTGGNLSGESGEQ